MSPKHVYPPAVLAELYDEPQSHRSSGRSLIPKRVSKTPCYERFSLPSGCVLLMMKFQRPTFSIEQRSVSP
jgi:hypothetical protein